MDEHDGPRIDCPGNFGRYRIERRLGAGGMGEVYLASDPNLDIPVAIKIPLPGKLSDPEVREQFWREARALAKLHHPRLCRIFDVATVDGLDYIAMAYVEGTPLRPEHVPTPFAAADLVHAIALAVAAAHRAGVVHRDLKPANILVDARNEPVVMDFGLALDAKAEAGRSDRVAGTIPYMAPEQARGEVAAMGPASDVFGLGVVLYELLAGRRPFRGGSAFESLALICNPQVEADAPTRYRPGLDPRLDAICLKALAKSIPHRYASMDELAAGLAAFLSPVVETPEEPALTPPRARMGLWGRLWRRGDETRTLPAKAEPGRRPGSGRVARDKVRFEFVGHGEVAPAPIDGQDRLYLDVGEGLRPAVIDHHAGGPPTSATSAALAHPEFVRMALKLWRSDDARFTIVLHRDPDLDALAATALAISLLCEGRAPEGAASLAAYVDAIDAGHPGMSLDRPFSPYSALMQVAHRLSLTKWDRREARWEEQVEAGLKILRFALDQSQKTGKPLVEIDAFDCPGLFRQLDREEVRADVARFGRKLADPATKARRALLKLPSQRGTTEVESLFVRDVQGGEDPGRCIFFKDWARTDTLRAPRTQGFAALCVSESGPAEETLRTILSVRPGAGVSLAGLGRKLEEAESARRREPSGIDDRNIDPIIGQRREPRPGYANADPWYDGRGHDYTMLDAPRAGSKLSVDEAEALFLDFGQAEPDSVRPA